MVARNSQRILQTLVILGIQIGPNQSGPSIGQTITVLQGWNKLWKTGTAKKFSSCPPTIPVCPHLLGAYASFCPPLPLGHARCDHNESESCSPTIICRHCVDQQTDSLVFTEFQSDHREWSHWKVGGQRLILPPCIEIWRGIRPPCPTACSTPAVCSDGKVHVSGSDSPRLSW